MLPKPTKNTRKGAVERSEAAAGSCPLSGVFGGLWCSISILVSSVDIIVGKVTKVDVFVIKVSSKDIIVSHVSSMDIIVNIVSSVDIIVNNVSSVDISMNIVSSVDNIVCIGVWVSL